MLIVLLFLEGLLAFASPCILPMLPIYLLYLSGDNGGGEKDESELKTGKARASLRRRVINTAGFILGFSLLFVALGALASGLGQFLQSHFRLLQRVSGAIMILMGLIYLDLFRIPLFNHLFSGRGNAMAKDISSQPWHGFFQSFFFGLAFSTSWTPCIGTFLASAMTLAANRSTLWEGMGLLLVFSMGLALPFFLTALLFEKLRGTLNFFKRHAHKIQMAGGILLILMGLLMLSNFQSYYFRLFNF